MKNETRKLVLWSVVAAAVLVTTIVVALEVFAPEASAAPGDRQDGDAAYPTGLP